jgi:ribosomal protein S18 acetylase RimI-like enzyme
VIRRARPADAAGIGRVYVESWRTTYPGLIPDDYLVGLSAEVLTARWHRQLVSGPDGDGVFVAVDGGSRGVVGFVTCGAQRSRLAGYEGEVYTLYLLDEVQGRGLGRRLMAAAAAELLGRGFASGLVWVLRDNPARWFYERLGGERLAEQTICLAHELLPEVAYGWRHLSQLTRLPANPPLE